MGTNFYWRDAAYAHIGKRSAAGLYCYDCGIALVAGGARAVHTEAPRLTACPHCGKTKRDDAHNAALVELGHAAPAAERPTGVQGASSFTWAQDPMEFQTAVARHMDDECIEDEYGRAYTGRAFLAMLESNCPIRFYDSVGREFS